jgi:predicted PurR-regulated permease PerM
MLLFRFPYSMTISTVVGATYVVPVVGGYVGAIIGALLIFSISPVEALGFIVFLLVLEQFEANVIFPKVIGSSIGLPAIWVLAAVAVGGGLGGVPFVLLSVPVAASIYQLIGDDMRLRNGWAPVADTAEATPVEAAATEPEQQEER